MGSNADKLRKDYGLATTKPKETKTTKVPPVAGTSSKTVTKTSNADKLRQDYNITAEAKTASAPAVKTTPVAEASTNKQSPSAPSANHVRAIQEMVGANKLTDAYAYQKKYWGEMPNDWRKQVNDIFAKAKGQYNDSYLADTRYRGNTKESAKAELDMLDTKIGNLSRTDKMTGTQIAELNDLKAQRRKAYRQWTGKDAIEKYDSPLELWYTPDNIAAWQEEDNKAYKPASENDPGGKNVNILQQMAQIQSSKAEESALRTVDAIMEGSRSKAIYHSTASQNAANKYADIAPRIDDEYNAWAGDMENRATQARQDTDTARKEIQYYLHGGQPAGYEFKFKTYDDAIAALGDSANETRDITNAARKERNALEDVAWMRTLTSIADDPNFKTFAQRGKTVQDTYDAAAKYIDNYMKGIPDDTFESLEEAQRIKEDLEQRYSFLRAEPVTERYAYDTGREADIYYALLGAGRVDDAKRYSKMMEAPLNQRAGVARAEEIQSRGSFGRTVGSINTSFNAGVMNAIQGAAGLLRDTPLTSPVTFAAQKLQQDATKGGRYVYQATQTVGNMLPMIIASYAGGPAVGAATMGISVAGNARQEALAEGYSNEQANTYGVLVGASEALLQYFLGGIGKLGGVASENLLAKIATLDSAFERIVATGAVHIGSEVLEEELQAFLEPAIASVVFGIDYDAPNAEELAEIAIVTILSTAALEGGNIVSVEAKNKAINKLITLAENTADGSRAKEMAQEVKDILSRGEELPADKLLAFQDQVIKDTQNEAAAAHWAGTERENINAVLETTGDMTEEHIMAQALQDKLDAGEALTESEVGALVRTVEATAGNEALAEMAENPEDLLQSAEQGTKAAQKAAAEARAKLAETGSLDKEDVARIKQAEKTSTRKEVKAATAEVIATTFGYGENGTKTFQNILENTKDMTPSKLQSQFQTAYEAGMTMMPGSKANLQTRIQRLAFMAGKADASMKKNADSVVLTEESSGFDFKNAPKNITKAQKIFADAFFKAMGVRGEFVGNNSVYNAFFEAKSGRTSFANDLEITPEIMEKLGNKKYTDKDSPFIFYVAHEVATHAAMQRSPESMKAFINAMYNYKQSQNEEGGTLASDKKSFYRSRDVSLNTAEAMEEVVADSIFDLYKDENAFMEAMWNIMNSTDETARQGAIEYANALERFIAKLKAWWNKITGNDNAPSDLERLFDETIGELENLRDMFEKAISESMANVKQAREDGKAIVYESAKEQVTVGAEEATVEVDGKQYSIKSLRSDILENKMFDDLVDAKVFTTEEANTLKDNLNDLIEYMLPNASILDMNESYTKENRPYSAYKPNSDPLYKISLDFSTLCRKRLMTQYVIEQLQILENRPMSAEEQIAIRSMLLEYRQQEKALQVACAMCYVEAARLKAPKQMEKFFADTESIMRKHFAKKDTAFNEKVKEAQQKFKVEHGYKAHDKNSDLKPKDKNALDNMSAKMRKEYTPSKEQQKIIDIAMNLPRSTFLTAENLTDLAVKYPEIYDAYTSHIRASTRSKSLESDIPYYYGDSEGKVSDTFIENVNAENGMRFDSWSDFQMKHMLDMITAVVDLSVRKSKMHGYTKFPEMVRIFGKTGMMFNLSGVSEGTGFDANGNLLFSDTEGINFAEAIKLREMFPDTAGLQCIGVSKDHIRALLRSEYVDYVIPYHTSGMNATLRRMAGIYHWDNFTNTQHARKDPKAKKPENATNWQVEPVWSEFYVADGKDGLDIMRKTADRYVQMCKERGLIPKFDEFANEPNYWKLLIDRKMVNQETGAIIEQQPVKPIFDFDTIKQEIDREVNGYDSGLEERALQYIVDNFDAVHDRIRYLKRMKHKKALQTVANEVLQAYAQGTTAQNMDGGMASLKGEQEMKQELRRIRTEGRKAGKSDADIEAEIDTLVNEQYEALVAKYGKIEPGEKPYREATVAKKTEDNRKVSQTVRTIVEAKVTPHAAIPTIHELTTTGEFSYDVYTDKAAIANAEATIKEKGYANTVGDWISEVKEGKVSKDSTALGWALYNAAANANDLPTAMNILTNMVQHQRSAAQALQATRILKKMTPDAQLYGVVRSVQNLEESLNKGKKFDGETASRAVKTVKGARNDAARKIADGLSWAKVKRNGKKITVDIDGN